MPHTPFHLTLTPSHDAIPAVAAWSTKRQVPAPLAAFTPEGKTVIAYIDQSLPILQGDVERGLVALAKFEARLRNQDAEEKAADDEGGIYNVDLLVWGPADVRAVPAWVDPDPLLTQPGSSCFSLFESFHQTFTVQRLLQMMFSTSPEAKAVHTAALSYVLACAAMSRMAPDDERRVEIDYQAYHDVCTAMANWMKANRAH